jgi:POT family proton-dependent oligopeptide transporter
MGINIGAFLGGLLMVWVGKDTAGALAFAWWRGDDHQPHQLRLHAARAWGPSAFRRCTRTRPCRRQAQGLRDRVYIGSLLAMIPLILLMVTNTAYTDMFMYIIGPGSRWCT